MSDLSDLAAAAASSRTPTRAARRKPAPRKAAKLPQWVWIAIAAVAVAGLGWVFFVPSNPGFAVDSLDSIDGINGVSWRGWEIINKEAEALTVQSVNYNGDHVASLAESMGGGSLRPLKSTGPVTLPIGGVQRYFQRGFGTRDDDPALYPRQVIFIEITTNRGTFKYTVADRSLR